MLMPSLDCCAINFAIAGKLWYNVFDASSNVIFNLNFDFHAELSQNAWRITTQPSATDNSEAATFHQVGTDGKSIYSLSCLNTNHESVSERTREFQLPGNNKNPSLKQLRSRGLLGVEWVILGGKTA